MGKLYLIPRQIIVFTLFFYSIISHAQNNYIVYKQFGTPKLKIKDSIKNINKGSIFSENQELVLTKKDSLLLIDAKGKVYCIKTKGRYTFNQIKKYPVATENTSFTKKYFSYVWKQFTNNNSNKSKVGVVFRNNNIILLQPSDSVKLFTSEIKFTWASNFSESYFHLKNTQNNHITKFGVSGNFITLFLDNNLLKSGVNYQWAIADKKFPNLEELEFYNFTLLTTEEYIALKPNIDAFTKDMKNLGFSAIEIKESLCNDYKICF